MVSTKRDVIRSVASLLARPGPVHYAVNGPVRCSRTMVHGSLSRCYAISSLGGLGPGGSGAVLLEGILSGAWQGFGFFGDFVVHEACLFAGVPARPRIGGLGWPVGLLRPGS